MSVRFYCRLVLLLLVSVIIVVNPSCSSPPEVTISSPAISPTTVALGNPVTIEVNISASGKKGVVKYAVNLKINDSDITTKEVVINVGESKTLNFRYTPQSLGTFNVDVNSRTAIFDVVKPAHFDIGAITITPESPETNQEMIISAEVTNDGYLPGTYVAVLKVNETEVSSKDIQIVPGQTITANASYTPETSGSCVIEFCGVKSDCKIKSASASSTSPTFVPAVTNLRTYRSSHFYF